MNILILQAHPDTQKTHLGHALAEAYAEGARVAGHDIRIVHIADLPLTPVPNQQEWESAPLPDWVAQAQADVAWCEHMVFFFPLWLGGMPAILHLWLENLSRNHFVLKFAGGKIEKGLQGKSARLIVTMGMPAPVYQLFFRSAGTRVLRSNILGFAGVNPVRQTLIGGVEPMREKRAQKLFDTMRRLGQRGE